MSAKYGVPALVTTLLLTACGSKEPPAAQAPAAEPAPEPAAPAPAPQRMTMNTAGITPEGVEFDSKNNRFLVGSLARGTVFIVETDGTLKPFIQDPDLKSSVGIEVDEERNRLLVANSDSAAFQGQPGQARLGIYMLDSGERIAMIDLAAAGPKDAKVHFANDLTVASDGSVYVTDSFARVIYKVDPSNNVSILLPNSFTDAKQHMMNGIVAHPGGYLIVAETTAGELYKVPLADPKAFAKVKLPEPVMGADGLTPHPNGNILVVRNDSSNNVVSLTSSDDWATATVASTGKFDGQATTAAVSGDSVYVVHPFFGDQNAMPFIERVDMP